MDSEGNVYRIKEMLGKKTLEEFAEDEERLMKALSDERAAHVEEQLRRLTEEDE